MQASSPVLACPLAPDTEDEANRVLALTGERHTSCVRVAGEGLSWLRCCYPDLAVCDLSLTLSVLSGSSSPMVSCALCVHRYHLRWLRVDNR